MKSLNGFFVLFFGILGSTSALGMGGNRISEVYVDPHFSIAYAVSSYFLYDHELGAPGLSRIGRIPGVEPITGVASNGTIEVYVTAGPNLYVYIPPHSGDLDLLNQYIGKKGFSLLGTTTDKTEITVLAASPYDQEIYAAAGSDIYHFDPNPYNWGTSNGVLVKVGQLGNGLHVDQLVWDFNANVFASVGPDLYYMRTPNGGGASTFSKVATTPDRASITAMVGDPNFPIIHVAAGSKVYFFSVYNWGGTRGFSQPIQTQDGSQVQSIGIDYFSTVYTSVGPTLLYQTTDHYFNLRRPTSFNVAGRTPDGDLITSIAGDPNRGDVFISSGTKLYFHDAYHPSSGLTLIGKAQL